MPISLRPDFDARVVRLEVKRSNDAAQARRLLALASIYEGSSRTEAAAIGSVTMQIVRDLGGEVQRTWDSGLDRPQAARSVVVPDRCAPGGAGAGHRGWADLQHPWRGRLAADRPVPVVLEDVLFPYRQGDAEPRDAGIGRSFQRFRSQGEWNGSGR